MKKFDLNIEKILENWEVYHAIREIIANAIDEQLLSTTQEVQIYKSKESWIIRDYGRGLQHVHLTQNENQEKLKNPNVIGNFGIGLKDALATFDRKGIEVIIKSKYCVIEVIKSAKEGFDDVVTLHAKIKEPDDKSFIGTEVVLKGATDEDVSLAKNLFLKFSGESILEKTSKGDVIKRKGKFGNIYINGVKVAEEENFLFSYNITSLDRSIKKALNRERTNVGRNAYSKSIKRILLQVENKEVAEEIADDLRELTKGSAHDELTWIDVQVHAVKILNQQGNYLFVTSLEGMMYPDMIDEANNSGYKVITIPDTLREKIKGLKDLSGNNIKELNQFVLDYNESFEFNFLDPNSLTKRERAIYDLTPKIIRLFGGKPSKVKDIKISSTMRKDFGNEKGTLGCWDPSTQSIVISKRALSSIQRYSATLMHELTHAKSGFGDVCRGFEEALTQLVGRLCVEILD
jgi:hypothetical protein